MRGTVLAAGLALVALSAGSVTAEARRPVTQTEWRTNPVRGFNQIAYGESVAAAYLGSSPPCGTPRWLFVAKLEYDDAAAVASPSLCEVRIQVASWRLMPLRDRCVLIAHETGHLIRGDVLPVHLDSGLMAADPYRESVPGCEFEVVYRKRWRKRLPNGEIALVLARYLAPKH